MSNEPIVLYKSFVSSINVLYIVAIFFCLSFCIVTPSWADMRQELYKMDKNLAITGFNQAQKRACIKAFHARYPSQYTLNGDLAFDEPLTLATYDTLFWKGRGSFPRGLLFTAPVTDESGSQSGNLVCYYATTESRLDFQSAYVIPMRTEETPIVSMIYASRNTLSGRE